MIKNSCNHETGKYFTNLYDSIKSTREAFGVIKRFTSHKKRETAGGAIYLDENKTNLIAGQNKLANAFGEHFTKNHNLTANFVSTHTHEVEQSLFAFNNAPLSINFNDEISPIIRDKYTLDTYNRFLPGYRANILTSAEEVTQLVLDRPN